MDHYSNYSGDDKRRNILFYLGVAGVFLAVCITAGCFLFRTPIGATDDAHSYSGIIYDENAVEGGWESLSEEEITDALNSKVEEGMINISMNTSPFFSSGTAEGNLMIVNQSVNSYPQKVEIFRNDTGDLIYTSRAIPVGSKISSAALDAVLEAGVYDCTAMFHSLDPETGAVLGSAGAIITITINS